MNNNLKRGFKQLLGLNLQSCFCLPGVSKCVQIKPSFEVYFQSHCGAASMKDLFREFMRKAVEVQ